MIEVYAMDRGSGKTTKVIEMLENDLGLFCLVPLKQFSDHYPKHLRSRLVFCDEFLKFHSFQGKRVTKLVLDEGFLYLKSKLAELYYTIGRFGIPVFSYGTE